MAWFLIISPAPNLGLCLTTRGGRRLILINKIIACFGRVFLFLPMSFAPHPGPVAHREGITLCLLSSRMIWRQQSIHSYVYYGAGDSSICICFMPDLSGVTGRNLVRDYSLHIFYVVQYANKNLLKCSRIHFLINIVREIIQMVFI